MHVGAAVCLVAALLALTAGVGLTAVGMIIDLARPLLDWINPMKAIKQNLNVLIAFFADMGILAVVWGIVTLLDQGRSRRRRLDRRGLRRPGRHFGPLFPVPDGVRGQTLS